MRTWKCLLAAPALSLNHTKIVSGSDKLSLAALKELNHQKGENEEVGAQEIRNLGLNLGARTHAHFEGLAAHQAVC